jgi:hypothetical protein
MEFPRINSIIAFLEKYSPSDLEKLRQQFPDQQDLLTPYFALGKKEDAKLEVYKATALIIISPLKENSEAVHNFLKNRLLKSKRAKFIFSLFTVLASATFLGAIIGDKDLLAKISAFIGLTSNLITLIIEQYESGFLLGKEKNLHEVFEKVIDIRLKTQAIEGRIKLGEATGYKGEELFSINNEANELSKNLDGITMTLGVPNEKLGLKK